ncbi:MAG: DUF3667 domain-containing protein [Myxococcaceae bacterium]
MSLPQPEEVSELAAPLVLVEAPEALCPNCSVYAATRYCGACGQRLDNLKRTLPQLVRELLLHFSPADGKLIRTVFSLLFKPGVLTRDYVAGRRMSYERPLRLFVAATALAFFAESLHPLPHFSFTSGPKRGLNFRLTGLQPTKGSTDPSEVDASFKKLAEAKVSDPVWMAPLREMAARGKDAYITQLEAQYQRLGPHLAVAVMPFLALLLSLLYRRRGWLYAEHFVFALHVSAFNALTEAFDSLVEVPHLSTALIALRGFYLVKASHTAYGGGWWSVIWRSIFVKSVHVTLFIFAMMVVAFAAIYAGPG